MTHTAQRWIDPTDDHRLDPSTPSTQVRLTLGPDGEVVNVIPSLIEPLTDVHWQRGTCSDPTCSKMIAAWCVGCGAKLCIDHAQDHRNVHAREHLAALRAAGREEA